MSFECSVKCLKVAGFDSRCYWFEEGFEAWVLREEISSGDLVGCYEVGGNEVC
jgi:hypothetical protein